MEELRTIHIKVDAGAAVTALRQVQQQLQAAARQGTTVQVSLNRAFASVNAQLNGLKNALTPVASVGIQLFARLLSLMQPAAQGLASLAVTLFGAKWTGVSSAVGDTASETKKLAASTTALAKAQRDLMGFDEIQRLSSAGGSTSSSGTASGGVGTDNTLQIETAAWAEKLKTVLARVWEPFQAAWKSKGKSVLSSARAMLESLSAAAAQVGRTWLDIWTDGVGRRILEKVLGAAENLCGTVGALADRFREAWNSAGNGERIVSALLGLAEDLAGTAERVTGAVRDWAEKLDLAPAASGVAALLEQVRALAGVLEDGLAWGVENVLLPLAKWTIETAAPAVMKLLAGALALVTDALTLLQPAAQAVWEGFLKPAASWAGDAAAELLTLFGEALSWCGEQLKGLTTILNGAANWGTKLKEAGGFLVEGLKNGVRGALSGIVSWLYANLVQPVVGAVKTLFGISDSSAVFASIGGSLVTGMCNGLKEKLGTAWAALSSAWTAFKSHFTGIDVGVAAKITTSQADLQEKWNALTGVLKDKTLSVAAKLTTSAASLWKEFTSGWSGKSLGLKVAWVTSGLNAIQAAVSKTLFGGKGWPKLAFAARGGVFDDPTLTVLGEAGREAVVPLENNTGWMDALARRIALQTGGGSGGGQTITVQCVLDGKVIAENTVRYVNAQARRTGTHPMAAYL